MSAFNRRISVALVCASVASLGGGALAATAQAGSIAVLSCRRPNGTPAPTEGWTSGWTNEILNSAGSSNSCAESNGTLTSFVGAQNAQPGSDGPFWEYAPPAGFTIAGGQITASFSIPGSNVSPYSAATGILGPKFQFDPADVIGGLPSGEWGSVASTWSL